MFLVLIVASEIIKERAKIGSHFQDVGLAALAIPPAIYRLIMFVTAAMFGWFVSRRT